MHRVIASANFNLSGRNEKKKKKTEERNGVSKTIYVRATSLKFLQVQNLFFNVQLDWEEDSNK